MHAKENRKTILNAKEDEEDKAVILSMLLISLTIPFKINVFISYAFLEMSSCGEDYSWETHW